MRRVTASTGLLFLSLLALTSCAPAPAKVYRNLSATDESRVLRDFSEVVRAPVVVLKNGKKLTAELTPTDPILAMPELRTGSDLQSKLRLSASGADTLPLSYVRAGALPGGLGVAHPEAQAAAATEPEKAADSTHAATTPGGGVAAFRTYFDLYQVTVVAPGDHEIKVVPKKRGGAFRMTVIAPIVLLLSRTGEVLAEGRFEDISNLWSGPPAKVINSNLSPGDYFVFVGADNSRPGTTVGYSQESTGGQMMHGLYLPGPSVPVELGSSGAGAYTIRFKAIKKH